MKTYKPTPGVIAHVSSAHRWTDNRVHLREAATLFEAGYTVHLIAVEDARPVPHTGVTTHLLPQRSRLRRVIVGTPHAAYLAWKTRAEVVHLHDPELLWTIPILRALGRAVIYDAHEDLPSQMLDKHYLPPPLRLLASQAARVILGFTRSASHIIAATPTIADTFPEGRATTIHNYPRLYEFDEDQPVPTRPNLVSFIGAMSEERGVYEMVRSFGSPHFPDGWGAVIAGTFAPMSLEAHLKCEDGWSKVDFHGAVGPLEARRLLTRSKVGLVLFQRNDAHLDSLPTKMFEYLAAGIPVIASDFPLWRSIVAEYECGMLVDETDPDAIAAAVSRYAMDESLLLQHSRNAKYASQESLNWEQEGRRLVSVYSALTLSSRP